MSVVFTIVNVNRLSITTFFDWNTKKKKYNTTYELSIYFGGHRNVVLATVHRGAKLVQNAFRIAGEQFGHFHGLSAHEHDLIAEIFEQTAHVGPEHSGARRD